MDSFKSQQHRWAKGSIQTAKKLLPSILKSDLPYEVINLKANEAWTFGRDNRFVEVSRRCGAP